MNFSLAAAVGIIDVRLVPILIEKLKKELDEIKVKTRVIVNSLKMLLVKLSVMFLKWTVYCCKSIHIVKIHDYFWRLYNVANLRVLTVYVTFIGAAGWLALRHILHARWANVREFLAQINYALKKNGATRTRTHQVWIYTCQVLRPLDQHASQLLMMHIT